MKKRFMSVLLLLTMIISMFPVVSVRPEKAEAAGTIYIEGLGNLEIIHQNDDGYTISLNANKDLIISGEYFSNSSALVSYHTERLFFTKEFTSGNPTNFQYYEYNVHFHDIRYGQSRSYDTYTVPREVLTEMLLELFGESGLKTKQKVRMSEGYIIKERKTASSEWVYLYDEEYDSLTGIQEARDWSTTTYNGFAKYFDIEIELELIPYTITVEAGGGGSVRQSLAEAYEGDDVNVRAYPDDDYNFDGWTVVKGNISGFDVDAAENTFVMPGEDITLKANFKEKSKPPATNTPIPTQDPAEPTPTGPTPTSEPTSTPVPTVAPVYHSQTDIIVRHYSTDVGHYIGKMNTLSDSLKASDDYAFGYFANDSGIKDGGKIYSDYYPLYSTGTDAAGNEWYFIPSGSNATYVHPKTYKGINVDSADIKNITELTFPEQITMSGTSYTVISIGGGTDRYFQDPYDSSVKPEYEHYSDNGRYYESNTYYSWYTVKSVGVLGNGAYRSHGGLSGSSIDCEFENSYYFENTTLKYITIPSTVTKIENYAFYLCQALEQVVGGEGVLSIGESAFASFNAAEAFQMSVGVQYQSTALRWYYYNCSKSTSITDTISLWRTRVSLPHDMNLPAFSKLQTISVSAFLYRSNLSDVFLPNTLQLIDRDAFKYCYLESITIPSTGTNIYDSVETLGTKGNVKKKTLIITNPGAKAMDYGLRYENYYDLRAGYSVTYVKNAIPNDTYVSNAMLVKQYANAVESITNSYRDESYFLDENGALYWKTNDKEATCLLSGVEIETFKKCHNVLFAISKSGELYELLDGTATKLAIPAGSRNFQFAGIQYTYGTVNYFVYFLNADGQICILLPNNTIVPVQANYPSSGTPYKFDRFVIEMEGQVYEGTTCRLYDNDGNSRYDWKLAPQIVAHAASDSPYKPNSLVRFYGKYSSNDDLASSYQPPEEITSYSTPCFWIINPSRGMNTDSSTGEYREFFGFGDTRYDSLSGMSSSYNYELYFVTDTALCQAKYVVSSANTSKHYSDERNGSYQISTLMTGEFGNAATSSYRITDYQDTRLATAEIDGQVYGFVRYIGNDYSRTARLFLLFNGNVEQAWEMSGTVSSNESESHDYDFLFVLGDDGNLYNIYTTETRGNRPYASYGKVVSNVSIVYKAGNNMFVLDTSGGLWAIGSNYHGAMGHSDAYSSSVPGMEWAFATKIEISGYHCDECNSSNETTFCDVYTGTYISGYITSSENLYYTLIESACGRVFAAGFNPELYDDYEKHPCFAPISIPMPEVGANSYRTGYVYEEPLYDNMFPDTGAEFLGWTLRADGSGTLHQPGDVLRITAPTTVYAKWDGTAKKRIVYIPNGGVGVMKDDEYPADTLNPVTLKKNTYTRKGYEFAGWSYKAEPGSSDVIYADEAQIVISPGIMKLYAQWSPITYTIKVGTDDVRVTDQTFTEHVMGLDTELTLGNPGDKTLTVSYNLNGKNEGQTSMRRQPEFVTGLTDANKKAVLAFYGWRLYEDTDGDGRITDEDTYIGYYSANTAVKNLTTKKDITLYFFPYWGGSASYVKLPEIVCEGYELVGFTPGCGYAPDYFAEEEALSDAIKNNILVMAPNGSGARYQPKADGEVLFAYYEAVDGDGGQVYGFEVYEVFGSTVWEEIEKEELCYTVGIREDSGSVWDTLPLRIGVHPYYRNVGGLPRGGGILFRVRSTGCFAEEDVVLTIMPYLCIVTEDGYKEVDVYYEEDTDTGIFLTQWKAEEQMLTLQAASDSVADEDGEERVWFGKFSLPQELWVTEHNTAVSEYQRRFGLDFTEAFWLGEERLMLRFGLCFENSEGEQLYYGMLSDGSVDNVWKEEAIDSYREDTEGNRYEIQGGEVAVIYPEDYGDGEYVTYGIY